MNYEWFWKTGLALLADNLKAKRLWPLHYADAQAGDVCNERIIAGQTTQIKLDEQPFVTFVIPDGDLTASEKELQKLYVHPAINLLADRIKQTSLEKLKFAPLSAIPTPQGVACYSGNYAGVSLRCMVQYNSEEGGIEVTYDTLFGSTADLKPLMPNFKCGNRNPSASSLRN